MAVSVTSIFINSIGGRPSLFFDALQSVGGAALKARPAGVRGDMMLGRSVCLGEERPISFLGPLLLDRSVYG